MASIGRLVRVSRGIRPPRTRSRCSVPCSVGGRMCIHAGSRVGRRVDPATSRPAPTSGSGRVRQTSIKCAECSNRRFLPVTDEVIRWHLSGRDDQGRDFVMGVYPMLRDETCVSWRSISTGNLAGGRRSLLDTCRRLDVPAALERSRSGNGGHIWLFFDEAIPAALARKLGSYLLTETMERRPDIGLRSYDRLFPNQDTLPKGGFGNLIALPLQERPESGATASFWTTPSGPHADQWAFLASVRRVSHVAGGGARARSGGPRAHRRRAHGRHG